MKLTNYQTQSEILNICTKVNVYSRIYLHNNNIVKYTFVKYSFVIRVNLQTFLH